MRRLCSQSAYTLGREAALDWTENSTDRQLGTRYLKHDRPACSRDEAPQPGAVALVGARVIDLHDGVAGEPSDILIRDGRIEYVFTTSPESIPTTYSRFDAAGTYVIPGLWDMHTHIRNDEELEAFIPLLVAHGIVGFRDMWGFYPREFEDRLREVGAFMQQLRKDTGVASRALELTILTAVRTNEVIQAEWSEFDLGLKVWVVPAERM